MSENLLREDCLQRLEALEKHDPIVNPKRRSWPFRRLSLRDTMRDHGCNFDKFYHWPIMRDAFISGATPESLATYHMLDEQHQAMSVDPLIGGLGTSGMKVLPNGGTVTFARQALACQLIEHYFLSETPELNRLEPHSWGDIFEFGGGFGALAYILKRLGFTGKHTIYDFPECSIIQKWYLATLQIDNIQFTNKLHNDLHPHIFISISGLDEAYPNDRMAILDKISAEYYFIWYHIQYHVDNHEWFKDYFIEKECKLTHYPSPHPNQEILIVEK